MSLQAPPTLLELARQSLLKNEALAVSALEGLPKELFPALFKEAFTNRCTKILRAMVQTWPFPCLPLGGLIKMKVPFLETLQVALDGIDTLLGQKVHSRRCKLQVLDLWNLHQNFWNVWAGGRAEVCFPQTKSKKKTQGNCSRTGAWQPLEVIVDLCLKQRALDAFLAYLFLWVEERKGLLQLGCKKLKISAGAIQNIQKVLEMLNLDYMQEVEICPRKSATLTSFAPYLGQMRNLQKFLLSTVSVPASMSPEEKEEFVTHFTSQFLNLDCLQELSLDSGSFFKGHLDQLLRCLKAPLETLSISDCQLSEVHLKSLSWCPSIHQLKHLNPSSIILTDISPEPLRVLLERVAGTLKTLDLEDCRIVDSQLSAFIPALSLCSKLTTFNYLRNPISVATLESLLCHIAQLSCLRLEMYSTPWEIYSAQGAYHRRRLQQLREELSRVVKPLKHARTVWFSVIPCPPS
uniref:PRAME like 13 n=1 Tax=Nannospalax galili TaxID=1026970 RepID=A0A8C6R957_NANGA